MAHLQMNLVYRFDENGPALRAMVKTIKAQGLKVRIITREVRHVAELRGIADYVSISLDVGTGISSYKIYSDN